MELQKKNTLNGKLGESNGATAAQTTDASGGNNIATTAGIAPTRELTYGEKLAGIYLGSSKVDSAVDTFRKNFAQIFDDLDCLRSDPASTSEQKRLYSIAITESEGALMRAVKAITFPY